MFKSDFERFIEKYGSIYILKSITGFTCLSCLGNINENCPNCMGLGFEVRLKKILSYRYLFARAEVSVDVSQIGNIESGYNIFFVKGSVNVKARDFIVDPIIVNNKIVGLNEEYEVRRVENIYEPNNVIAYKKVSTIVSKISNERKKILFERHIRGKNFN